MSTPLPHPTTGRVIERFARSAGRYDAYAHVQWQCAERLAAYIEANTRDAVAGPILEVGCGTGILSRKLADLFADRSLIFTDASDEMVARCQIRLKGSTAENQTFKRLSLSQLESPDTYSVTIAAFVLQWLPDLDDGLRRLGLSLKSGGKIFFSVPEYGSFPEWKSACQAAGVRFTGNALPKAEDIRRFAAERGMRAGMYRETFTIAYRSLEDFLNTLKRSGASTAMSGEKLTVSETKRLLATARSLHPTSFTASYKVLFGHMEKRP